MCRFGCIWCASTPSKPWYVAVVRGSSGKSFLSLVFTWCVGVGVRACAIACLPWLFTLYCRWFVLQTDLLLSGRLLSDSQNLAGNWMGDVLQAAAFIVGEFAEYVLLACFDHVARRMSLKI